MNKFSKKLLSVFSTLIISLSAIADFSIYTTAKEQTTQLPSITYKFEKKNKYEIDSANPVENSDSNIRLGKLSINGDINKTYEKDGYTAFEIKDGELFSLNYTYISTLKDASKDDWHLIEDSGNKVNGSELPDDIDYGAIILQTSLDGKNWVNNEMYSNFTKDISFGDEQINNIQLANGCYYRVIRQKSLKHQLFQR